MVDGSLGWKVLKMPFLLLAFLITLKRFDTIRGYLKDKQKSSHNFMFPNRKPIIYKCNDKDACVGFISFYFQRHYIPTMSKYHDISITVPCIDTYNRSNPLFNVG